jgi:hypothetical protein
VLNTSSHTCIADLTFVSSILAVRLNRARLVVVEEVGPARYCSPRHRARQMLLATS